VKLIVTAGVAERFGEKIRDAAPGAEIAAMSPAGWQGDPDGAELAYISVDSLVDGSIRLLVEALPKLSLKWVHTFSIGLDDPAYRRIVDQGIPLTNGVGTQSQPIAQHVLLMMLHHVKGMANWERNKPLHRWERTPSDELTGKTVCLLGLGGIGAEVAKIAKVLGMRVIGLRRSPDPVPNVDEILPQDAVGELCARADFLVICAPLTRQTKGMVGPDELARMKPSAYIINVARGPLIQEPALIAVLTEGRIAGAALDVFDQEPLPADHPLWDLPNVVITPHQAPSSPMHLVRGTELFIENLRRYIRGEPLMNVVNPDDVGFE
jgi:phosphoglycerate dehydrogenase-like enzyme